MLPLYTATATATGRDGRAASSDGKLDVMLALQKELGGTGAGRPRPERPGWLPAGGHAAHPAAGGLPPDAGRELVEATHLVCPYSNATRGNIPVELLTE